MRKSEFEFRLPESDALLKAAENENKFLKSKIERQNVTLEEQYDIIDKKDNVINILKSKLQNNTSNPQKENKQFKEYKLILSQNDKIMNNFVNTKEKRHVKEPTEPVFKDIMKEFSMNYGKLVVSNTSQEILKLVSKDEF